MFNPPDCWMTGVVSDPDLYIAVRDAQAALTGWTDIKVRRIERSLCRAAKIGASYRGARRILRLIDKAASARLTDAQIYSVQILRFAAAGDARHAKEFHALLREQWHAQEILRLPGQSRRENAKRAARATRKNSIREQLRRVGVTKYAELKDKAPELRDRYTKRQLVDALSKINRKSP